MTAQVSREPVPYDVTEAGRRALEQVATLTLSEASEWIGLAPAYVVRLVREGDVDGVQVDDAWLVDGGCLAGYMVGRVPAAPLLRQILLRGGDAACGVVAGSAEQKALERARATGVLTIEAADRLTVRVLGLTPWEVWPHAS